MHLSLDEFPAFSMASNDAFHFNGQQLFKALWWQCYNKNDQYVPWTQCY